MWLVVASNVGNLETFEKAREKINKLEALEIYKEIKYQQTMRQYKIAISIIKIKRKCEMATYNLLFKNLEELKIKGVGKTKTLWMEKMKW